MLASTSVMICYKMLNFEEQWRTGMLHMVRPSCKILFKLFYLSIYYLIYLFAKHTTGNIMVKTLLGFTKASAELKTGFFLFLKQNICCG